MVICIVLVFLNRFVMEPQLRWGMSLLAAHRVWIVMTPMLLYGQVQRSMLMQTATYIMLEQLKRFVMERRLRRAMCYRAFRLARTAMMEMHPSGARVISMRMPMVICIVQERFNRCVMEHQHLWGMSPSMPR